MDYLKKSDSKNTAKNLNIAIGVLIIAVITVLSLTNSKSIVFDSTDDAISVSGPEKSGFVVLYDEIVSISENDNAELGTVIEGKDDGDFAYGIWQNEIWGTYHLCINRKITNSIVITTAEDVYVFNYDSDILTEELYNDLLNKFEEKSANN